jgi:hypothetical protein
VGRGAGHGVGHLSEHRYHPLAKRRNFFETVWTQIRVGIVARLHIVGRMVETVHRAFTVLAARSSTALGALDTSSGPRRPTRARQTPSETLAASEWARTPYPPPPTRSEVASERAT